MKERFLHYLWMNTLYGDGVFVTVDDRLIRILNPGQYNRDAGPDFFNARIEVDGLVWVGNVEIHVKSKDWYRHGHHLDSAYDNVILSVVAVNDGDIYKKSGEKIDCVVLEYAEFLYREYLYMHNSHTQPACRHRLNGMESFRFYCILESLAVERLERKVADVGWVHRQSGCDWKEAFFRLLCKYWAGNVNAEPFYQLALQLPYKVLLRYADNLMQIEALLFGCAGLLACESAEPYVLELRKEFSFLYSKHRLNVMDARQWKFMRVRPDAFPTVRIALLASFLYHSGNLISRLPEASSLEEVYQLLDREASAFWDTHYLFEFSSAYRKKKLGRGLKDTIVINAVIPFVFQYGRETGRNAMEEKALMWLEAVRPEQNYIVRSWEAHGFVFDSALQTQALIQLRKEYCDQHRCLSCPVGAEVFKEIRRAIL